MKRTDKNTGLELVVSVFFIILFQVCIVMLIMLFTGSIVNTVFGFGLNVQEVFGIALLTWFSVRAFLLYR